MVEVRLIGKTKIDEIRSSQIWEAWTRDLEALPAPWFLTRLRFVDALYSGSDYCSPSQRSKYFERRPSMSSCGSIYTVCLTYSNRTQREKSLDSLHGYVVSKCHENRVINLHWSSAQYAICIDLHFVDPIQLLACFPRPSTYGKCSQCLQQLIGPSFDLSAIIPGAVLASTIVLKKPIRVSASTDSAYRTIQHATLGATV